jgi:O-antigen ligase
VLWVVKRSRFTAREIHWVLGALIVSTVVGLIMGYATWTDRSNGLKLNSVGHVNHTAIYLAIMLGLCVSWLFTRWQIAAIAVTAFVLVSLFVTASRGAVAVGMMMLPLLAAGWWRRSRIPAAVTIATLALATAIALVGGAEVIRKQQARVQADNVLAFRDGVWRIALETWERYPWFGVGMDNFGLVRKEHAREARAREGKNYDPTRNLDFSHAHSLYLNTLAERGLAGFIPLAAVLTLWLFAVFRYRPKIDDPDDDWLLWGSCFGAWIVTVGVGMVNTTLHHEHAILAVLLLGLWLSRVRTFAVIDTSESLCGDRKRDS